MPIPLFCNIWGEFIAPASFENENAGTAGLERLDGITCGITQLRPSSKGYVEIKSNNILDYNSLQNKFPFTKIRFSKYSKGIASIYGY